MAPITCGSCRGTHASVKAVKLCHDTRDCIWQIPFAFGFSYCDWCREVHSADESVGCMDDFAAQQAGEIWAENAWLRHAEGWYDPPDREEELAHMAEASGVPIPPGYY